MKIYSPHSLPGHDFAIYKSSQTQVILMFFFWRSDQLESTRTQGLIFSKKALYHLIDTSSPCVMVILKDASPKIFGRAGLNFNPPDLNLPSI
jgi:hypothetical protein